MSNNHSALAIRLNFESLGSACDWQLLHTGGCGIRMRPDKKVSIPCGGHDRPVSVFPGATYEPLAREQTFGQRYCFASSPIECCLTLGDFPGRLSLCIWPPGYSIHESWRREFLVSEVCLVSQAELSAGRRSHEN